MFWSKKMVARMVKETVAEEAEAALGKLAVERETAEKARQERDAENKKAQDESDARYRALPAWRSVARCPKCCSSRTGAEVKYRGSTYCGGGHYIHIPEYTAPGRMILTCKCRYSWQEAPADREEPE